MIRCLRNNETNNETMQRNTNMTTKPIYSELVKYMGLEKLPKDLCEAYGLYVPDESSVLLPHDIYEELLAPYELSKEQKGYLDEALAAIEADEKVLFFSRFFVWDMCSMRNKYDIDRYTELKPGCLGKYNEAYAFLVMLSCVPVAEKDMIARGIPRSYYEDIPHRMLRLQLSRYKKEGRIDVEDMPWKMNFYTLTIFLLDRFLFIPYAHGERFRLYRSVKTGKVIGICEAGCTYDTEGQLLSWGFPDEEEYEPEEPDIDDISDTGYFYSARPAKEEGTFKTTLTEDEEHVTGYYMNPVGYTENKEITLDKNEYKQVLFDGDYMIALHIPEGEGYTPERLENSMRLALDFFKKYYPELDMKGFWSSSWLYDERLRFILSDDRNIPRVQDRMFRYSDGEDGSMLYVHLYKDMKNKLSEAECTSSLQKGARECLRKGIRFMTTGMMILTDEALSGKVYYTQEDKEAYKKMSQSWS